MLRSIVGVVVGCLVMAMLVFGLLTALYLAVGTDGAFKPATYEVSTMWIGASTALGLIAAIVGGLVCAKLSKSSRAPLALIVVVVVLGVLSAASQNMVEKPDPGPRTGDVSNMDAMMRAKTPTWVAWSNPVVGAVGVLIGASLGRRKAI